MANQVPFVRLVAKEEEEVREEVREKRRATSASLAAGSIAGEGSGRRQRHGERAGISKMEQREGKGDEMKTQRRMDREMGCYIECK